MHKVKDKVKVMSEGQLKIKRSVLVLLFLGLTRWLGEANLWIKATSAMKTIPNMSSGLKKHFCNN